MGTGGLTNLLAFSSSCSRGAAASHCRPLDYYITERSNRLEDSCTCHHHILEPGGNSNS